MKRIGKIALVLLFVCLLALVAGAAQESGSQYTLDTPYEYPIVPGTQEWIDLGDTLTRRRACQIPDEILQQLTTDALFQTVLDYPFLNDMYAYNDFQTGFETVKRRFNGLQELANREDALAVISNYFVESCALSEDSQTLRDNRIMNLYAALSISLGEAEVETYASRQTVIYTPKGSAIEMM